MMSSDHARVLYDAMTYAGVCALVFGVVAAGVVGVDTSGGEEALIIASGLLYGVVGMIVGTLAACARGRKARS